MTTEHTLDVQQAWQALATRNIGHVCDYCGTHPDAAVFPRVSKDSIGSSHLDKCRWLAMDQAVAAIAKTKGGGA